MPTLAEMLAAAGTLEEKLAECPSDDRAAVSQKKACIDFAAFGLYKEAVADFLPALKRGLGWGAGLGIPLLGGGLLLEHQAKSHADDLVGNVRNQALLASLGMAGANALGQGLQSAGQGASNPFDISKISADTSLQKLAAHLLLDDVLVQQLSTLPEGEKQAAEACLILNREEGADLLRKLLR